MASRKGMSPSTSTRAPSAAPSNLSSTPPAPASDRQSALGLGAAAKGVQQGIRGTSHRSTSGEVKASEHGTRVMTHDPKFGEKVK